MLSCRKDWWPWCGCRDCQPLSPGVMVQVLLWICKGGDSTVRYQKEHCEREFFLNSDRKDCLNWVRKSLTEADKWSLLMNSFNAVTCHDWCVCCSSVNVQCALFLCAFCVWHVPWGAGEESLTDVSGFQLSHRWIKHFCSILLDLQFHKLY